MAEVKVFDSILETEKYRTVEFSIGENIKDIIEREDKEAYKDSLVECYDSETGNTFYANFIDDYNEEETSVLITVNKNVVGLDYCIKENDIVNIVYLPLSGDNQAGSIWTGIGTGILMGALAAAFIASELFSAGTATILWAGLAGAVVGGIVGGITANELYKSLHQNSDSSLSNYGKEGKKLPDVRGAENQSLTGNTFPYVFGKHLVTPFIIGAPYVEYSGDYGEEAYIRELLCVGYGPLKLTDFKLGDFYLAYNRSQGVARDTLISGTLRGYSTSEPDDGDILDYWNNNDITLEIIQQPSSASTINKGNIYNAKVSQHKVDANLLFVSDKDIEEQASIVYKGRSFPNNFRTNTVIFTESCPSSFTVTIDLPNGIYGTYSDNGTQTYRKIPLWLAIQWRPYSDKNASSDSNGTDYAQWNNITTWNGVNLAETYTITKFADDLAAHKGNAWGDESEIYNQIYRYTDTDFSGDILADCWRVTPTRIRPEESFFQIIIEYNNAKMATLYNHNIQYIRSISSGIGYTVGSGGLLDLTSKTIYLVCPSSINAIVHNNKTYKIYHCSTFVTNDIQLTNDNFGCTFTLSDEISGTTYTQTYEAGTEFKICSNFKLREVSIDQKSAWVDCVLTNLENSFTGEDCISEMRLSSTVTLTDAQKKAMLDSNNSIKGIEVRAIRVSPNYLNMTTDQSSTMGPESYSDSVVFSLLTTTPFDEDYYLKNNTFRPVYPLSDDDYKKLCLVSIKAKADESGYIENQMKAINCIAESFSPVYDSNSKKILPENVTKKVGYYKPHYTNNVFDYWEAETEAQFYEARQSGDYSHKRVKEGSNYKEKIDELIYKTYVYSPNGSTWYLDYSTEKGYTNQVTFPATATITLVSDNKYVTTSPYYQSDTSFTKPKYRLNDDVNIYLDNNSMSSFLLSAIGPQCQSAGKGYEDFNLFSLMDWYQKISMISDGSTFSKDESDEFGTHKKGDLVYYKYAANGYLYQAQKLEDLLKKIAITGRAVYTIDDSGKIKVIFDGPVDYPAGVISQQTSLNSSCSYNYEEFSSGLQFSFSDENDGYETNTVYCWSDNNSLQSHKGDVESYGIEYVTNPKQLWSLGRYVLACKELQRNVIQGKIGPESIQYEIGDVVLVQLPELMLGRGDGRIEEVIESNNQIYGFIMRETYEFDDARDSENSSISNWGVTVLQPMMYGKNRTFTLRLKTAGTYTIGGETYVLSKGISNLVLFKDPINKYTGTDYSTDSTGYLINPDDICMLGYYGETNQKYRLTKIKPEKDFNCSVTYVPYFDELYNYGKPLPSFQPIWSKPPAVIDPVSLSEVPTTVDEISEISNKDGKDGISPVVYSLDVNTNVIHKNTEGTLNPSEIVLSKTKLTSNGKSSTEHGYTTVEYDGDGVEHDVNRYLNQAEETYSSTATYYDKKEPVFLRVSSADSYVIGDGYNTENDIVGGVFLI